MATNNQLKYGSSGEDVKKLQETLNQNGYNLEPDGIFGNKTLAAVKDYQTKNGLAVDGIAGKNTLGKLYSTQTNTQTDNQAAATQKPTTQTPTTQAPSASENPPAQKPTTTIGGFTYDDFAYEDYSKSDTVLQAESLLNQHNANKPGSYTPVWQDEADAYLSQYQNRDPFSYDFNSDALYQQYKDQYIQQGRMAMMDTMGQAQAMTGGYGNSYAQTVGQQVYNQNLNQLNNIMPELYDMAYGRYNQEGQDLLNMYGLYMDRENQAYNQYQNELDNWYQEADRLTDNYNALYERDYGEYTDKKQIAYDKHLADKDLAWDEYLSNLDKEQAAAELMASTGDYDRLKDVYGLSDEEIAAIKDANKPRATGTGTPKAAYKNLTADQYDWLEGKFKRMDQSTALQMAELYASDLGVDPSKVAALALMATGGLPQSQPVDTSVTVNQDSLKARQEQIRKDAASKKMKVYETTR